MINRWGSVVISELLAERAGSVTDGVSWVVSPKLKALLDTIGKRVIKHSALQFEKFAKKGGGLALKIPGIATKMAKWRTENTKLVTRLMRSELKLLRGILTDNPNKPVLHLAKLLRERLGISKSKARLIARTETNKLNSQINTERATAAGIVEFTWTTMGDERVSEAHEELDGQTFSYDDPPTDSDGNTGLPGEIRPNCRCIAYPIIPEFSTDSAESGLSVRSSREIRPGCHRGRTDLTGRNGDGSSSILRGRIGRISRERKHA